MKFEALMQTGPARANELFAKITDTSDGAVKTRERIFSDLKAELELQCGLEEEHLFPILMKNLETKHLVADAMTDNQELRAKLAELEGLPKNDTMFATRIAELRKAFRQHARDEKKELLPAVQRALSEPQVQAVAERIETDLDTAENNKEAEAEKRRVKVRQEREQAERQAAERQQNVEVDRVRQAEALRAAAQAEQGVRRAAESVTDGVRSVVMIVRDAAHAYTNTAQCTVSHLQSVTDSSTTTLGGVIELQSTWLGWLGKTAAAGTQMSQDLFCQAVERQGWLAAEAMQTSQALLRQVTEGQRQLVASAMQGWMESNARVMHIALRVASDPLKGNSEPRSGTPDNNRA